jgi:DNA repair exonuclease SbcCD ATPase subunit
LHPEHQQEELKSVKEKIDVMKNDLSSVTVEMSEITRVYRSKAPDCIIKIRAYALQSKKNEKETEIKRAKNELAFIESELANVGRNEDKK